MKYIIQNPGKDIESKVTVDREEVVKYLMKVYNLKDRTDVNIIGDIAYVYINDETLTFSLADFEKVNGEIRYKKKLPQIPKKADSNEKKSEEKEDATELPKQNEEDKKLPSVDKSEKETKNSTTKSEDKKVDEKKNEEKTKTDKPTKSDENKEEKENKNN